MRTSYSLGSLLRIDEVLECARLLSDTDAEAVWVPETWGMENFSMLGAISGIGKNYKLGSSIINIYSRSPALIGMGAATIDTISRGRLLLGLGTSSVPIVEEFHGYKFDDPVRRMKEYVEIIRTMMSGGPVEYSGRIFKLKNFSLLIRPFRTDIPIYLAAVNQRMLELAWDVADGVIFYLRPINEISSTVSRMQAKRKIDVACQLITSIDMDSEAAILRAKKTLAFYISVGKIYREFLAENGFRSETRDIFGCFAESGLGSAHELVPDKMLDALAVAGTPEDCQRALARFRDAGIGMPILQFNPVGDTMHSFRLLLRTFSGDAK